MIIQYFGKQFFKISQGDFTVALNPISKDSKEFNKAKFGSNAVLITTNHPDFNGRPPCRRRFLHKSPQEFKTRFCGLLGSMVRTLQGHDSDCG
jgi:hypothetical protein